MHYTPVRMAAAQGRRAALAALTNVAAALRARGA
jgi:hypothetical protein